MGAAPVPKNLDDLLLFAVDTSGLDLSKLTVGAGGLRDASAQLVRLARPVSKEFLEQVSKTRSSGSNGAAIVGAAVVGVAVGVAVSENRDAIGQKAREAWRRVRGESVVERSFDPWKAEPSEQSDGVASASWGTNASEDGDAPRHTPRE